MPRCFFNINDMVDNVIRLTDSKAHHIINVLRTKIGENVILCCGDSFDYHCSLMNIISKGKSLEIFFQVNRRIPNTTEPKHKVTLYQSVPKLDKLDLIIQKAVEIGVSRIVPVVTSRSVVRPKESPVKLERSQKIAESAAMQSDRGIVPAVFSPSLFNHVLSNKENNCFWLVADESEKVRSLKHILLPVDVVNVGIWVGPEGGFTESERIDLKLSGAMTFSLGSRVLRTETAAIVALSQFFYSWEM